MKILLATYPFGIYDSKPLDLLNDFGCEIITNPFIRRLKASDMNDLLKEGIDGIIAGTEPYDRSFFERHGERLKVIARVGIGLDSIDFEAAAEYGVKVTYTPDAPSQAVAELVMGQILNLNRYILNSDRSIRQKAWNRMIGWLVKERSIGILGLGRIGKLLVKLLKPYGVKVYVHDLKPDLKFIREHELELVDESKIFSEPDLLSIHIPLNNNNFHFINRNRLSLMKTGAFFINTSRGPIVDEEALTDALLQKHLGAAALDVFEDEPYEGILTRLDNVILTGHIGASTRESRKGMEFGAAEDCIRILAGKKPLRPAILD